MKIYFVRYFLLLVALVAGIDLQAQNAPQNSLLWEVSGKGLKQPSYVYGTIHLRDKRVFAFNDSVLPKLKQCQGFATEIAFTPANEARMVQASMLPAGKKLKDFFSEADYKKLSGYLAKSGIDIEMLQQFKPFVVISMAGHGTEENSNPYVVDQYLSNVAKENDKTIMGIELVEEQMALVDKLPIAEMLKGLDDTDEAKADAEMEVMLQAYINEDLVKLQQLISEFELEDKLMGKELLTDRNHTMADRMALMFGQQSVFAAIGAAHLPGSEGVLELLRKKGYTVKPIIAKHTPTAKETAALKESIMPTLDTSEIVFNKPFLVDNSDFTVTFPGMPDTSSKSLKTAVGETTINLYTLETDRDNVVFTASYVDYPKEKEPKGDTAIKAFLDAAADGTATQMMGSKIKSKAPVALNGHAGIDVVIDYMNGKAVIHMFNYLVGKRLYTVQVINSANKDNNPEMKAFFASFKLKH